MANAKGSKVQTVFSIPISPETRAAISEMASAGGISSAELGRRILSKHIASAGETEFQTRLEKIEAGLTKTSGRVNAVIALLKSIEDDEQERRGKERLLFRDLVAQSMEEIGQVIGRNSEVITQLATQEIEWEGSVDGRLDRMQRHIEVGLRLLVAVIHGSRDPGARASYRTIEAGMADGKKLADFLAEAMRKE